MDTKKLKQKILDLAIRGKLVPQNPNDEPASALLERIRVEKEHLIKEKKIKRDKNESHIYRSGKSYYEKRGTEVHCIDDEIPFEIPESWEWTSIKAITTKITDGTHHSPSSYSNGEYKYITAKNIKSHGLDLSNITYVDGNTHNEIYSRCNPEYGDILYIKDGATTGIATINNLQEPFSLLSSVALIKPHQAISNQYLLHFLQSSYCYNSVRDSMKGVGITRVTLKLIEQWKVSLPPLSEQERIVESIEQAFALIDSIDSDKADLLKAIKQTKAKVLDLAIRGKLVTQDPNDEPASVLLERIKAEMQASVKGSKKHSKQPVQTSDNSHYPFDIPNNWEWCEGCYLMNQMESTKPNGDVFRYIDIESINNKKHIVESPKTISSIEAPSRASRLLKEGDTIFSMVRPYLENIAFIDNKYSNCIASTGFYVCSPNIALYPMYLFYLMTSQYVIIGLNSYMKGDNSPSINNNNITSFLYPLPPLAEQKRIVSKIKNIFSQLDQIEESLKA